MLSSFRPRHYILFTVLLVSLTCWQYIYCALQTPPQWQFSGLTCDIVDQNTYLAFMAEARSGQFFLGNLYTGEIEKPAYCNLFWWALGTFCCISGLSLAAVFQLSRILCCLLFLLVLARFISYFLADGLQRWCALLLLSIGTGFGWILMAVAPEPKPFALSADLSIPEAFAIMSMLWKPHFVFALIVQMSILWLFLTACEQSQWPRAVGAGLLALLLGFTHAFHLITIYLIALTFSSLWIIRAKTVVPLDASEPDLAKANTWWRPLFYAFLLIALSAPSILYLSYLVRSSPVMAAWQKQNINLSPPVWSYLLGFGPMALVILCCPSAFVQKFLLDPLRKPEASIRNLFLFVWIICNSLLLYSAPLINFERRLVQGLQIPLAIVAVQLFFSVLYPLIIESKLMQGAFQKGILSRQTSQGTLCLMWLLSGTPTTLYHFTSTSFDALPPRSPYYLSPSEQQAAAYLRQHSAEDAVILAPEKDGSWLPYMTERHIFVGHPVQTLDYAEKSKLAKQFFSGTMSVTEQQQILQDYPVDYIYWPVQKNQPLPSNPLWKKILNTPQVQVFQVQTQ